MSGPFRSPRTGRALAWSAIVWATTALGSCLVALALSGTPGLGSAAVAGGAGLLFPALTAAAAIVADRRHGRKGYAALAFFAFLLGFVVKVAVFVGALVALLALARVVPGAVYGALVATAIGSLFVDVICANGIRSPRGTS